MQDKTRVMAETVVGRAGVEPWVSLLVSFCSSSRPLIYLGGFVSFSRVGRVCAGRVCNNSSITTFIVALGPVRLYGRLMGSTKGGGGSRPKPPKASVNSGAGYAVATAPPPQKAVVPTSNSVSQAVLGDPMPTPLTSRSASGLGGSFLAGNNGDPAKDVAAGTQSAGLLQRFFAKAGTTPGLLSTALSLVAVASILLSLLAGTATLRRSGVAKDLRDRKAAVMLDLLAFDASIREADAAATTGFLAGGVEPTRQRKRYDDAIAKAARSLASVSASIETGYRNEVALIAEKLPEYTALVSTARANNRQGFPSGSAYIRASSSLLREQVLPETAKLEERALSEFKSRYGDLGIGGFLAAFLVLGAFGVAALLLFQKWVAGTFHRKLNVGLAGSTLALLASMVIALITATGQMQRASGAIYDGLRPSLDVSNTRVRVFSAKADDALGLIGRGNADSSFASARGTLTDTLIQYGGGELQSRFNEYVTASAVPRDLALDTNDYAQAIDEANREGADSTNGTFDAFASVSNDQLGAARETFADKMGTAVGTPRNSIAAIVGCLGLSALLAAWGIRMRLREYQ
jgi:hypothetical protein